MTTLRRACIRAGVRLAYSGGFNPRPKISLPLPRSVGIESYGDFLLARLQKTPIEECYSSNLQDSTSRLIAEKLRKQVPSGLDIETVELDQAKLSLQPVRATYEMTLKKQNNNLTRIARKLIASDQLKMQRHGGRKKKKVKDVRPFIQSIDIEGQKVHVSCGITPDGTIRVDELMELLQLKPDMLEKPIKRMNVQWNRR